MTRITVDEHKEEKKNLLNNRKHTRIISPYNRHILPFLDRGKSFLKVNGSKWELIFTRLDNWWVERWKHANEESVAICVSIWSNTVPSIDRSTALQEHSKARHARRTPDTQNGHGRVFKRPSLPPVPYERWVQRSVGFSKQGPQRNSSAVTHSYGFSLNFFFVRWSK